MKRFDDKRFQESLDTRVFGRSLIHLLEIGSTNDYSAGIIDSVKDPEVDEISGTLVLSDKQTGGRGRFNHKWLSPHGGLWFSLIFKTVLSGSKVPALTLLAAYAAADILINDYGININIKWPNDLYCADKKFGGILSEEKEVSGQRFIIMGMGLNIDIDREFLEDLDNKAINIQDLTEQAVIPERLLAGIMKRFEELYLCFSSTGDLGSIFKKIEKILRY